MTDAHSRPSAPEVPLTPADTAAPSHAERARTLVSLQGTGALSTIDAEGFPHGSYITFALLGPDPVFLVSKLASHTQNLMKHAPASLMVYEARAEDPLANGRVTLLGPCERDEDPRAREAFLKRHPGAAYYADFADFGFFRLRVERIRYIGGYGRMSWVDAAAWRDAQPDPIGSHAAGIIDHMNADHADAVLAYARAFTTAADTQDAVMTGVDRYGFEMSVSVEAGRRPARVAFDAQVTTPSQAREALVALAKRARQ